ISIGNSPRPIVALHVLHRLIVPRHPPCAHISNKSNTKTHTKHMNTTNGAHASGEQQNHKKLDTRVHYTVLKQHEHHPHTTNHTRSVTRGSIPTGTTTHAIPDTQQRNKPSTQTYKHNNTHQQPHGQWPTRTQTPPKGFLMPTIHPQTNKQKLLRKEVIQPHLPVRLPCYDFVPIADPTFDSSLTSLGHWLRVLPTFMT